MSSKRRLRRLEARKPEKPAYDPYAADVALEAAGHNSLACDCGCQQDTELIEMQEEHQAELEHAEFVLAFPQYAGDCICGCKQTEHGGGDLGPVLYGACRQHGYECCDEHGGRCDSYREVRP